MADKIKQSQEGYYEVQVDYSNKDFEVVGKEKDLVSPLKLITDYNSFKEQYLLISKDIDFPEIDNILSSFEDLESGDFNDNFEKMKNMQFMINFIDNYNKQINSINIVNNTDVCNKLILKQKDLILKTQNDFLKKTNENEVSKETALINEKIKLYNSEIRDLSDDIHKKYYQLRSNEYTEEQKNLIRENRSSLIKKRDSIQNEVLDLLDERDELLKPKGEHFIKTIYRYFIKPKTVEGKHEEKVQKLVNGSMLEIENTTKKSTALINSNNISKENSIGYLNKLDKDILVKNTKLLNGKDEVEYLKLMTQTAFINAFNETKKNSVNQDLQASELMFPDNAIDFLNKKIIEQNKKNYYGFIATSMDDVSFHKNTHIQKIKEMSKGELSLVANKFKTNKIYAISFVLTFAKNIAVIATSLIPVVGGTISSKLNSIFNIISKAPSYVADVAKQIGKGKDVYKEPSIPKEANSVELSKNLNKQIDKLFDDYSFTTTTKKDYINFYEKFEGKNEKNINLNKQIDNIDMGFA